MAAAHHPRTMVRLLSYPLKTPTETAYLVPIVRKYRRPGKTTKRHWRRPAQVATRRKLKRPAKSMRRRMRTITNKRKTVQCVSSDGCDRDFEPSKSCLATWAS